MHVLQYLVVEAPDEGMAVTAASNVAEDASWSDWCEIGGRWDGAIASRFPNIPLSDGNVLPILQFPVESRLLLDEIAKRQDRAFLEARDAIAGNAVAVSDVPGHIFGLPVADTAGTAQRLTESNRKTAQEWNRILSASSLKEARFGFSLAPYHAQTLLDLTDGKWTSESAFYDATNYTCDPSYLMDAMGNKEEELGSLFFVAVDFHY